MASQYRTSTGIQRSLATSGNRAAAKMPAPYVHCRIDPFTSSGDGNIPDGSNNNFVTLDRRVFDNITPIGEPVPYSFNIMTTPTYPCSAAILASTRALNINGAEFNNLPNDVSSVVLPSSSRYAAPLSIVDVGLPGPSGVNGRFFPGQNVADMADSASARLVSAGYRLIYTGPVNTCSGSITVTPTDTSFTASTQSVSATTTVTVHSADGGGQIVDAGTMSLNLDGYAAGNRMTRESVTFRPEQGVVFIPRHKSRDFKIKSTRNLPYSVIANPNSSSTPGGFTNLFAANANKLDDAEFKGGIIWYDDDWSGATIAVQNVNADATFRWETIWCMEFNPSPSRIGLSNFTTKASPTALSQINEVQDLLGSMPVARPANMPPTVLQRRPRRGVYDR